MRYFLKGSLVNQAFLTAHILLYTLRFSGFFLLGNQNVKIKAEAEQ